MTNVLTKHVTAAATRRGFCRAAAGAFAGLALTRMTAARAEADVVHYFTWGGYDEPFLHQPYMRDHGDDAVSFTLFGDSQAALQKIRSGFTPDVYHPCLQSALSQPKAADILQPIDIDRLEHWPDVFQRLKDVTGIVDPDGTVWAVPIDFGFTSVIYRTDLVDMEEESFSVLVDPQYAGRIAILDNVTEQVHFGAKLAGIDDPWNMNDDEMAATVEVWRAMLDNAAFMWVDQTSVEQAIASGEVVAAVAYNESFVKLRDQGVPVDYMFSPKEGIFTWLCGLSIVNGAEASPEQMHAFIDSMLAPETGVALMENYGYGHSNALTYEALGDERMKELGWTMHPKDFLATAGIETTPDQAYWDKMITLWDEAKAAAGT